MDYWDYVLLLPFIFIPVVILLPRLADQRKRYYCWSCLHELTDSVVLWRRVDGRPAPLCPFCVIPIDRQDKWRYLNRFLLVGALLLVFAGLWIYAVILKWGYV